MKHRHPLRLCVIHPSAPATLALLFALLMTVPVASVSAMQQQAKQVQQEKPKENGRSAEARMPRSVPAEMAREETKDVLRNGHDFDGAPPAGYLTRGMATTTTGTTPAVGNLSSLKVQPGAPAGSIHVAEDGSVGLGTDTPKGRFHVRDSAVESSRDILLLDANGNLEIGGLLTEASSALLKTNFEAVNPVDVLARVAQLPITTWNYHTEDPAIRHMGPMAQDFHALFGLGADDEHLAALDVNGVALASIQALTQQMQQQEQLIAQLAAQNAALLQRLAALEARAGQQH